MWKFIAAKYSKCMFLYVEGKPEDPEKNPLGEHANSKFPGFRVRIKPMTCIRGKGDNISPHTTPHSLYTVLHNRQIITYTIYYTTQNWSTGGAFVQWFANYILDLATWVRFLALANISGQWHLNRTRACTTTHITPHNTQPTRHIMLHCQTFKTHLNSNSPRLPRSAYARLGARWGYVKYRWLSGRSTTCSPPAHAPRTTPHYTLFTCTLVFVSPLLFEVLMPYISWGRGGFNCISCAVGYVGCEISLTYQCDIHRTGKGSILIQWIFLHSHLLPTISLHDAVEQCTIYFVYTVLHQTPRVLK